ncbi:host attachment family protein [Sulfitobacter sp. G21635-S1]|jgi:protein required for attachment to host cells|uniref:host attachment family protein n=1 Tax=Sulfitobacter sp. G21635-S1 TaxID=3014043 RepID=UPI0022AE63B6|nr:host attachment family protein [Sulfitobacter sp. G21635-S1]MCZ4256873.1 host attachment family protein [Sulfitobacter sp. G21635-S1]
MTKLTNGTWVLIADGEKALFLVNQTDGEDPFLEVFREEAQDNPPNREQAANRRGRFNDGPSVHRSAVQDTDWHQLAKDRFAGELAEILYRKAHQGAFDRIVLVAPPHTLGELRREIHKEVADRVVAEVPKTLTNHPVDQIETLVAREIAA